MSILIKGMKMPESGYIDIRLHTFADGEQCATVQTGEHPFYKKMGIVEVPEPHGRLIDADELDETLFGYLDTIPIVNNGLVNLGRRDATISCRQYLQEAPTVIEAEGKEDAK